jgi:acyl-CoA synthetase (NDP forming)
MGAARHLHSDAARGDMSSRGIPETLKTPDGRIPSFAFPESSAIALARAAWSGAWRAQPLPRPEEKYGLLSYYGLPVIAQRVAESPEDAGQAAGELGGAMAPKAIGPEILHKTDPGAMIRDLKGSRLLKGLRGRPARDTTALEDILLRVGAMVEDLPQIAELDCNPVIVHEHGATVVDARVRIAAFEPPPLLGR